MSTNLLNLANIEPFTITKLLDTANTTILSTSSSRSSVRITSLEFFNLSYTNDYTLSVRCWSNTTSNITEEYVSQFTLIKGSNIIVADSSCPIWLGPHNTSPRSNSHGLYITVSNTQSIHYIVSGEYYN
jgi:hypothetical protein